MLNIRVLREYDGEWEVNSVLQIVAKSKLFRTFVSF